MPVAFRKTKGEIREDLLEEYESLGRPGAGKKLKEVVQDVEDEMSRNLDFKLDKVNKNLFLVCGDQRTKLPDIDNGWKHQIFKEQVTGIPYISTGKTATRCIRFFQEDAEVPTEKKTAAPNASKLEVTQGGLPGSGKAPPSSTVPGGPGLQCHCNLKYVRIYLYAILYKAG